MDINKDIKWSSNLEHYFKEMAEKSYCYSYLHKKAEAEFSYKRNFIDLPVIVLSTALGTLSIGGEGLFGSAEREASMFVGAGSIFVGILSTIGTYFGFAKRAEAHRISHIQYSKLYRFLQIELSLPVEERMRAADLLKVSRDNYERLQEVAPLIPHKILEDFKERFKGVEYKDISKPSECNGLEKVEIFVPDHMKQHVFQVIKGEMFKDDEDFTTDEEDSPRKISLKRQSHVTIDVEDLPTDQPTESQSSGEVEAKEENGENGGSPK